MWPRLLAQLVELIPAAMPSTPESQAPLSKGHEPDHIHTASYTAVTATFREEFTGMSEAFNGVALQLSEQKKQISDLQQALEAAETHRLTQTNQLEWLTGGMTTLGMWVKFGTTIMVILLGGLIALTLQVFLAR